MDASAALQLADWRRQVGEVYAQVRTLGAGERAWAAWRDGKRRLYRDHPQSPVPADARDAYDFECFPYDASMRALAELTPGSGRHLEGDDEVPGMTHVGMLQFAFAGTEHALGAYWLDGYAGGLFVPFADTTSGKETYGGGRYVLDTAKGADLGVEGENVVLDFNFAYAPSCAHDARWRCPLAPAANRLAIAIRAGEVGP